MIFVSAGIFANTVDNYIDSALNRYNQKDYLGALAYYDTIQNHEYSSSNLYFNMANCYYRINDIANAVYYYEKSLLLNPDNEDAKYNLNIVNSRLKLKVEVLPIPFYKRWETKLVQSMSSDSWAILSIIAFALTLLCIAIYLFVNILSLRKAGFFIAIIMFVVFIFSMIMAFKSAKQITETNDAIVYTETFVKSSPDNDSQNLFSVCEGLKVEVTDSVNSWYNIKLQDGKQGWTESATIRMLK